jgi:large subunit ribosomal protein L6
MSRVGKHPVDIPSGVSVDIAGRHVTAKGKLGALSARLMDEVSVTQEGSQVWVQPKSDTKRARMMWGTARTVVHNLVNGVDQGFTKKLEIQGVGYRAQVQGRDLVLQLGYSHEVRYPVPEGITVECPDPTHILIRGADRQKVGQVAAEVRAFRKVEPYKGKGIRYADEIVRRKEGKKK